MYLGPSLRLDAHSGSVHCLVLGVGGPFTLHVAGTARTVHSALVPPRTTHRVVAHGERMLFGYLDPDARRAAACRDRVTAVEAELLRRAGELSVHPDAGRARELLEVATGSSPAVADHRIRHALGALHADPGGAHPANELAAEAGLSVSRFLHLFSAQTQTTFRRYRLWARMLHVANAVSKGLDLTGAAAEAGFASPSHFSDAFHAMFGLTPSALLGTSPEISLETLR